MFFFSLLINPFFFSSSLLSKFASQLIRTVTFSLFFSLFSFYLCLCFSGLPICTDTTSLFFFFFFFLTSRLFFPFIFSLGTGHLEKPFFFPLILSSLSIFQISLPIFHLLIYRIRILLFYFFFLSVSSFLFVLSSALRHRIREAIFTPIFVLYFRSCLFLSSVCPFALILRVIFFYFLFFPFSHLYFNCLLSAIASLDNALFSFTFLYHFHFFSLSFLLSNLFFYSFCHRICGDTESRFLSFLIVFIRYLISLILSLSSFCFPFLVVLFRFFFIYRSNHLTFY
ncbi:unnamed protein product [Acanthosepion pharaonis]|uniref:Uncharacterized protein n=1 Tax=Acanthosepion pharaonis TaxID=158019 RepID=A0A812D9F8_ACAPH|nr:unnamed protein product [Sepia pharaonis]